MSMMMMERKWKRQNIGQNHSKMKDIQMVESIKIGFKSLQTQKHLNQSVFNREGINQTWYIADKKNWEPQERQFSPSSSWSSLESSQPNPRFKSSTSTHTHKGKSCTGVTLNNVICKKKNHVTTSKTIGATHWPPLMTKSHAYRVR